jgi:hypothetical protein
LEKRDRKNKRSLFTKVVVRGVRVVRVAIVRGEGGVVRVEGW